MDHRRLRRDSLWSPLERIYPEYKRIYESLGWRMLPGLDRVYVNARARERLGWQPKHDFASILARLEKGEEPFSELSRQVGSKGYHDEVFKDGPFPVGS